MLANIPPVNNKVKGLLKGLRYISQIFDEEQKEQEMMIGNPTDVKHVAHIGWDGPQVTDPSWMTEFHSAPLSTTFGNDGKESGSPKSASQEIPLGGSHHPPHHVTSSRLQSPVALAATRHPRRPDPNHQHVSVGPATPASNIRSGPRPGPNPRAAMAIHPDAAGAITSPTKTDPKSPKDPNATSNPGANPPRRTCHPFPRIRRRRRGGAKGPAMAGPPAPPTDPRTDRYRIRVPPCPLGWKVLKSYEFELKSDNNFRVLDSLCTLLVLRVGLRLLGRFQFSSVKFFFVPFLIHFFDGSDTIF